MKSRLLSLFLILVLGCQSIAFAEFTIDGYKVDQVQTMEVVGDCPLSTSTVGNARICFDQTSGKLQCSEDGGAYTDCVGGGGGTPGGSNPQLQYNSAGSFGGVSGSGVDANGNVGIGSVNPVQKLEVNGIAKATTFISTPSANPGIYAGADSNTGLVLNGSDVLQLATSGSNWVTVAATGNVGIGQDSTPDAVADISKIGSVSPLMVSSSTTGDGDYLIVNSAGNVGIGTSIPSALLDIQNQSTTATNYTLRVTNSAAQITGGGLLLDQGVTYAYKMHVGGTGSTAGNLYLDYINQLTGATQTGNILYMSSSGNGLVGIGTSNVSSTFNVGGGASIGRNFVYSGAPTNGAIIEGNVGIGSTVPGQKLDVAGAIRPTTGFAYSSALNGSIYKGTTNGMVLQGVTGSDNDVGIFSAGGGNLFVNPTGTNHVNLGAATNNVGINSAAPNANLAVVAGTAFPIAMFHGTRAGIQGVKIANTNTAQKSSIVLAEEAGNSLTPFVIARNGSTAATDPLAAEINNVNAGDLKLMTNNTERMRITSAGNVGIGGDTTPDAIFETAKVGSTPPLMVSSAAAGDGDYFIVNSAGNVGIGINNPNSPLRVVVSPDINAFTINAAGNVGINTGTASYAMQIHRPNSTAGFTLLSNSATAYTAFGIGRTTPSIYMGVVGNADEFFAGTQSGDGFIKGTDGNTGALHLNATTSSTGMVLKSSGNVGIATMSPGAILDVNGHSRFKTAGFLTEVDDGNSSTADTIDWTTGNRHKSTMTGNCTYTFTAPTTPTAIGLKLVQDGTGSRTATWPAAVKWPGGTAPTLTTTAAAVDYISCFYDGTNYLCNSSLDVK